MMRCCACSTVNRNQLRICLFTFARERLQSFLRHSPIRKPLSTNSGVAGLGAENRIVKRAERLVAGYFDLLGFHNLSFGNPIDWHLEPVAGNVRPSSTGVV